jgi:two-component system chemotaxis response regulator CheB
MNAIRVLVVDDSALARQIVSDVLAGDPAIAIIAAVADPIFAMARMRIEWPDVLVLDFALKRVSGLTFLRKIMAERPTPVIVCATSSAADVENEAAARAAGVIAFMIKPGSGLKRFLEDSAAVLIAAVKSTALTSAAAPKTPLRRVLRAPHVPDAPAAVVERHSADVITAPPSAHATTPATPRIVALGASTGGTLALERVLMGLPRDCPGIVVVQHMPENFTATFAARLNSLCAVAVREAVDGEPLLAGLVLIAPGGRHLMLRRSGSAYFAEVVDGLLVSRHKPSVDVLFRSVAKCAGANALGVIMTGMGDDGARGLLEMHQAGAATLAQDEDSCVVFGMPKEAIKLGAAQRVLPLGLIAQALIAWGTSLGARNPNDTTRHPATGIGIYEKHS